MAKTTKTTKTTNTAKRPAKAKPKSPGDVEVAVCRRRGDRRQATSPAKTGRNADPAPAAPAEGEPESRPVAAFPERRKVPRRRQIDPTTCERDYTQDEIEFMHALDAYKRSSGRMFPTCSEILEVVRGLGYARLSETLETPTNSTEVESVDSDLATEGADRNA